MLKKTDIIIYEDIPSTDEYIELRRSVNWSDIQQHDVQKGLNNSVYSIVAKEDKKVIAMCRIVGDFSFMFLIADMIVLPTYQGRGIGEKIMTKIMLWLKKNVPKSSSISLMAAAEKEGFYEKFGFFSRPTTKYGSGMMINLSDIN